MSVVVLQRQLALVVVAKQLPPLGWIACGQAGNRRTTDACSFWSLVHPTDRRPDLHVVKDKHILLATREKPSNKCSASSTCLALYTYIFLSSLNWAFIPRFTEMDGQIGQGVVLFTCPDFSCPTGSYCTERVRVRICVLASVFHRLASAFHSTASVAYINTVALRGRRGRFLFIFFSCFSAISARISACLCWGSEDGRSVSGLSSSSICVHLTCSLPAPPFSASVPTDRSWLACELDQQKLTNKINLFRRRIASKSGLGTFVSGRVRRPVGWLVSFATNCLSLAACSWLVIFIRKLVKK
ncbi:hypothetical protein T10_11462 [Trichinella papuae]|uniref:Transmembrane protein n=1 Tax=Trichinella papuae TaxID=268474 RepID=A0A0V1MSH3_9BILA|nr:hypothetical protein T10_11462 [Trichinella papuae]